jgi:hypothetical protein
MHVSTKRFLWTLVIATVLTWGTYSCCKFSQKPGVLLGIWFAAVAGAFIVVKIGRQFPTAVRQEWNLGWGRRLAITMMQFAFGLVALGCIMAWLIPQIPTVVIYGLTNAGLGLIFGALLGCGGVLGVSEDSPHDVPPNDSSTG